MQFMQQAAANWHTSKLDRHLFYARSVPYSGEIRYHTGAGCPLHVMTVLSSHLKLDKE